MIAYIPLSQRPIITCTNKNWTRTVESVSCDGEYIHYHDKLIKHDKVINLTAMVGVVAYAYKQDSSTWIIFDFSASHLCHNQIKKVIMELLCNYS